MVGPLGGIGVPTFDLTALGGWFNARALGAALTSLNGFSAQAPQQRAPAVMTPWDFRQVQPAPSARLRDALRDSGFIEAKDPSFDKPGVPEDHKKLFALYKALSRLQTLAEEAASDRVLSGQRPGYDTRFQTGLTEILAYAGKLQLDGVTLLPGAKSTRADAEIAVPRLTAAYTGAVAKRGSAAEAVPGLTGAESFTVRVVKFGQTSDLTVDLSTITGPLTLNAIADAANAQLQSAGLLTRFKVEILEKDKAGAGTAYGLKVEGVITEQVSFSAPATQAAVYLGGVSGTGPGATGQLVKLGAADGPAPAQQFARTSAGTGASEVRGLARDSQGNVYTVGWASGTAGPEDIAGARDAVLQKFDSAGQLVWSRTLGASEAAEGFAVTVDASDNVIVAGRTTGRLSTTSVGGGGDSFVTKYTSAGAEVFTRQIAPLSEDQAAAVTVAADGSIYVAGSVRSAMAAGVTAGGGADVYVQKLSATGALVYTRQFGGAGDERPSAIALAADGGVYVASTESGQAVVRRFADDGTSPETWSVTLGDLQGGRIGGLAVDGDKVYLAGATANAALDAGGAASIARAASGGTDAFVFRLTDGGASASADYVSYLGTGAQDRAFDVKAAGGAVYLAGDTQGVFAGQTGTVAGASNGFVAKLDANGALDWVRQFGGAGGQASARALAVDTQGSSVLDVLGLPKGRIAEAQPRTLDAHSGVRAGDSFTLAVGRREAKIVIAAGETLRSLMVKINNALFLDGKATVRSTPEGERLRITVNDGRTIELKAGPKDFDALAGLGLAPGKVMSEAKPGPGADPFAPSKVWGLGLAGQEPVLSTKETSLTALRIVNDALNAVRQAYRALTYDPELAKALRGGDAPSGPVPQDVQNQLANYQAALARLTSGGGGGGLF